MRMLAHLWMVLTLALGICGDDLVKRGAEDIMEGSGGAPAGQGSGTGRLPITGPSDDSDYSSSVVASMSEYYSSDMSEIQGSGASYEDSYDNSEEETNKIRVRGEFTISGIGRGNLDWMPDLADPTSKGYQEMANLIAPIISNALKAKKSTRTGLRNVRVTGFRHGSIITEYEASYEVDSTVTSDAAKKSIKDAITNDNFGGLQVDPKSVNAELIQPVGLVLSTAKPPKDATPQKPDKPVTNRPTTQSNAIDERNTKAPMRPVVPDNEVIDIDTDPTEMIGDGNDLGNELGQKGNPDPDPANIWDMLFSHPAILAGLVGAVVLALLTVVLLLMFIIYRIKKKDEGSYSLDEPHKVKDPMAYWKDTKEFYA